MNEYEKRVLDCVKKGGKSAEEIAECEGIDEAGVYSAIESLKQERAVSVKETVETEYVITQKGEECLKNGFPEERVVKKVMKGEVEVSRLKGIERSIGVGLAIKKGLVAIKNGMLELSDKGRGMLEEGYGLRKALEERKGEEELIRRGLLYKKDVKRVYVEMSKIGEKILS